jgi:hypothetical protein
MTAALLRQPVACIGTVGCSPSRAVFESGRAMTRPNSGELPPRGRLTTGRRKLLALDLLSQGHTLSQVKKALGINRVTIYRWRQHDPSFAHAYSDAMEAGTDLIEQEARRRAVDGYDRPIFQRGELAGLERVYSDMLLALLLRGRRPEIFRETTNKAMSRSRYMAGCLATPPRLEHGVSLLRWGSGRLRPPLRYAALIHHAVTNFRK